VTHDRRQGNGLPSALDEVVATLEVLSPGVIRDWRASARPLALGVAFNSSSSGDDDGGSDGACVVSHPPHHIQGQGHPESELDAHGHHMPDLQKQSQNPVANLISLPIEIDVNRDVGYRDSTQVVTTFKPVVPTHLNDDWLLVHRAIVPLIDQPKLSETSYSRSGLGDITYQGYFVPEEKVGPFIVGFGPQVQFPTATDEVLGSDQWTVGPAAVGLLMEGPWVAGALLSNSWTFARSDSDRDRVRALTFQPFIDYNFEGGWYVVSSPVITANWNAEKAGDRWTVPVGIGFGRVFKIGTQPVNFSIRPYYNVHRPDDAARWSLQFNLTFLFPEGSGE